MSKSYSFCHVCGRVISEDGIEKNDPALLNAIIRINGVDVMPYLCHRVCGECAGIAQAKALEVIDILNQRKDAHKPEISVVES